MVMRSKSSDGRIADGIGRPIMIANPTESGQMLINGSPVVIASQMPNVEPGATRSPLAAGRPPTWSLPGRQRKC